MKSKVEIAVQEKGTKISKLAEIWDCTRPTVYSKIKNPKSLTASEIDKLALLWNMKREEVLSLALQ